jgi:hypothetical protein
MKTNAILLIAALFCYSLFPAVTQAQFVKGSKLVEGGIGSINYNKTKATIQTYGLPDEKYDNTEFAITFSPRVGFFITRSLVIGTTLGITYDHNQTIGLNGQTGQKYFKSKIDITELDCLPFARYYFPGKGKTRFYGQVGGGVLIVLATDSKRENYDYDGNVTSTTKLNCRKKPLAVSWEALVGINHFVSENVAINAGLGYKYLRQKVSTYYESTSLGGPLQSDETTQINITNSISWNVGFTMFIPCKKKK